MWRRTMAAGALGAVCLAAHGATVEASLAARAERPVSGAQRPLAVIVELEGRPDLATLAQRWRAMSAAQRPGAAAADLRAAFERAAARVRPVLERAGAMRIEPLWIVHGYAALLPPKSLETLAATPGVARIYPDVALKGPTGPVRTAQKARNAPRLARAPAAPRFDAVQWRGELPAHLAALGVAAWWQRGVTGKGVTVAVIDSGVDSAEPTLAVSFRGGRGDWFDPFGQHSAPFDGSGHGTHVANVIAGGAPAPDRAAVGVAPDARWIAARIYDDAGVGRLSAVHRAYQWALDPDGVPATPDAPLIVNNSWGLPQTVGRCEQEFAHDFAVLRAVGIHVVFAAGNTGPDEGTSLSPANNPGVLAVGALRADGTVADQSARGPSACGGTGPWPQVLAPGVELESADAAGRVLGDALRVTGTSYAAGLASGMLALLASESPQAGLEQRERALAAALARNTATPTGASPTALAWRPALGADGSFEIDARTLQRVLPWTARMTRLQVVEPPARGRIESPAAGRLRYVAEDAPAPFVVVAHTADGAQWRIAVQPRREELPAGAVPMRRISVAARAAEPLLLSREQLAPGGTFTAVRASQTLRGGQVDVADDGSVRYTARAGFRGTDQFVCTLLAADGSPRERVQIAVMVR